jgi:hypothetical protein
MSQHDELQHLVNIHKSESIASLIAVAKGVVGPETIRFGGTLIPEAANTFVTMLFEDPFLQRVTTRRMSRINAEGGVLDIPSRGLRTWPEGTEPPSTVSPTNHNYLLTAKPASLPMDLGYSFFIDNQDNPNFRTELETAFVSRIRAELTDLAFNGDEAAAAGPDHDFLVLNNGWIRLAEAAAAVQKVTIDPVNEGWIDSYDRVLEKMPALYRPMAEFIANTVDRDKYAIEIGQHVTGVSTIANERASALITYPVLANAFPPEKHVLFTNPKNLIYGVAQDITRAVEDRPRLKCFQFTWHLWVDFDIAVKAGAVLGRPAA